MECCFTSNPSVKAHSTTFPFHWQRESLHVHWLNFCMFEAKRAPDSWALDSGQWAPDCWTGLYVWGPICLEAYNMAKIDMFDPFDHLFAHSLGESSWRESSWPWIGLVYVSPEMAAPGGNNTSPANTVPMCGAVYKLR